jgi:hypothetical protein
LRERRAAEEKHRAQGRNEAQRLVEDFHGLVLGWIHRKIRHWDSCAQAPPRSFILSEMGERSLLVQAGLPQMQLRPARMLRA